jgi:hypothetical protein
MFVEVTEKNRFWAEDHNHAMVSSNSAYGPKGDLESSIKYLCKSIDRMRLGYEGCYESLPSDDGVLGSAYISLLHSLRTLLNGETGRIDCGTIDEWACKLLSEAGEEV